MSPASVVGAAAVVFHGLQSRVFLSGRERFGPQLWSGGGRNKITSSTVPKFAAEGPSCIFIGPIEKASQEMLEALYHQARDSYYSGKPLIVDDMFDKVELKLRLYRSKSVVKYPRCSLRRQSTYADADGRKTLLRFLLLQVYGYYCLHLEEFPFWYLLSIP